MMARTWAPLTAAQLGTGDVTDAHSFLHGQSYHAWENIVAHGAQLDGSNDSGAIQDAIDELPAEGGTILVPGRATCDSPIDLDGRRSIVIKGIGGLTGGASSRSALIYTGTGTNFIDARHSAGVWLDDLSVLYTNASFTGHIVDFRNTSSSDPAYGGINRCFVGGSGASGAASCVAFDKAIMMKVADSYLNGAAVGVLGRSAAGTYSNRIKLDGVTFSGLSTAAIKNVGQAWKISACEFNPLVSGDAGAIKHDSGIDAMALTVEGCWFGDVTAAGTQMLLSGIGLNVRGNFIGGNTGTTAIGLDTNGCQGVHVTGNMFDTHAIAVKTNLGGAANHDGLYVLGNGYANVTSKFEGGGAPGARDDLANLFTGSNVQMDDGATVSSSLASYGGLQLYGAPGWIAGPEVADPGVAGVDRGHLFFEDAGGGKTRLRVRFQTGAAITIATEA